MQQPHIRQKLTSSQYKASNTYNMASFSNSNSSKDGASLVDTWGTKGFLTMDQHETLVAFLEEANADHLKIAKFNSESLENAALRFLRARKFVISDAKELLEACVQRKTSGRAQHFASLTPNECVQCDLESLKTFYPHAHLGYDKFKRPILFEQSGRINPSAITTMTTYSGLVDYHFWTMEHHLNEMFDIAAASNPSESVISTCAVLDLEGLGVVHCTGAALEHVKALIALDNVCYPETLGKMFVINSPWLAVTTWEVVRGWLDPRTQAKIEILGSGPETTAKLLEYIDADSLPRRYGGTAADWEPQRPQTEYLTVSRSSDIRRTIHVPPGHVLTVDSYVPEGEIVLEIYVNPTQFPEAPAPIEGMSGKSIDSTTSSSPLDALVKLSNHTLLRHENHPFPARNTQEFPNPTDQYMQFTVRWINTAILVGRSIVANIYTTHDPSLLR